MAVAERVKIKSNLRNWFANEIQHMAHGFGDCRKPLFETAELIEEIVHQQMMVLLQQTVEVCTMRNGKHISMEDLLFIMRKNKTKLRRLLKYLELKDLKTTLYKSESVDDADSGDEVKPMLSGKRTKICYDFLCTIDQTGELLALFNDNNNDEIKEARALRAELQTRSMDHDQYKQFCEARQVSFSKKYNAKKFKDWLLDGVELPVKPNIMALEVMSYLAYECIAQIIDLALLVKQDTQARVDDPMIQLLPNSIMNHDDTPLLLLNQTSSQKNVISSPTEPGQNLVPNAGPNGTSQNTTASTKSVGHVSKKMKKSKKSSSTMASYINLDREAIHVWHVKEAMRRYGNQNSIMSFRTTLPPSKDILLCC